MHARRLVPVLMVLASAAAAGQASPVDQGIFTVTRGGAPFGTESFLIIRQPGPDGAAYTLSSTRIIEGRIIRTSLKTDSSGQPITYLRQESGGSPVTVMASGKTVGRLTVNFNEGDRRSSKDYLMKSGSLLLDDDLFHQLYFVCLEAGAGPVAYIAPAARRSATEDLVAVGEEELELGNKARVPARHFALGTGAARRDIWIDSSKRLLRISIPGRQIEALRDDPPR